MEKKFIINTSDIAKNVQVLKEKINGKRIYAVLKGNAYGMGLIPFANELFKNSIKHFCVTDLEDALILKDNIPECDVLLLTPCEIKEDIENAVLSGITLSVDSLSAAKDISEFAKKNNKTVNIHIMLDTGMGRYGFLPEEIDDIIDVSSLENINVEGIFTHLHSAFNKKEGLSLLQFELFNSAIKRIEEKGLKIPIKHICNSIAAFRFPQMHLDAVRLGSALIGRVSPICGNTGLVKIGTLIAHVVDIRSLPKGHNVGYASLYKAKIEIITACVNVGYADGIEVCKATDSFRFIDILRYGYNDFKLLFKPKYLICKINGKISKSIGRIGMTNLVLDTNGNKDIKVGDEVQIPANPIYLSPLIKREYK